VTIVFYPQWWWILSLIYFRCVRNWFKSLLDNEIMIAVIVLFQMITHNYMLIFFYVLLAYYSITLYQTKLWWMQIETILTSLDAFKWCIFSLCRILTRVIDSYAKKNNSCIDIGCYHQSGTTSIDWLMKFLFVAWGMF